MSKLRATPINETRIINGISQLMKKFCMVTLNFLIFSLKNFIFPSFHIVLKKFPMFPKFDS